MTKVVSIFGQVHTSTRIYDVFGEEVKPTPESESLPVHSFAAGVCIDLIDSIGDGKVRIHLQDATTITCEDTTEFKTFLQNYQSQYGIFSSLAK